MTPVGEIWASLCVVPMIRCSPPLFHSSAISSLRFYTESSQLGGRPGGSLRSATGYRLSTVRERRVRVDTFGVSGVVGGCGAPRLPSERRVPAPPGRRSELQGPGRCAAAKSRGNAGCDDLAERLPPGTAERAERLRSPGKRALCCGRFVVTRFALDPQRETSAAPKIHLTAGDRPSDVSTPVDIGFESRCDRSHRRRRATTSRPPPIAGPPKTSLTRSRFMSSKERHLKGKGG